MPRRGADQTAPPRALAGRALAVSIAVTRAARLSPDPPIASWRRTNYRGQDVTLTTGLTASLGVLAGAAAGAGPLRVPAVLAGTAAALAGGYDDLRALRAEQPGDKGLAGHLAAARSGRLSGGAVKVVVIGAASVVAARAMPKSGGSSQTLLRAGLIAGTANLVNLLDLRPGRAGKAVAVAGLAGLAGDGGALAAAVLGTSVAALPEDLGERGMLGDLGANTMGAVLGVRLAALPLRRRMIAAGVVGGLTLASERVSFSRVIDSVAALRWFDQLGRVPAARRSSGRGPDEHPALSSDAADGSRAAAP